MSEPSSAGANEVARGTPPNEVAVPGQNTSVSSHPQQGTQPAATGSAADLPEIFGRYRVQKKLGQGGMGTVYLAEDTILKRPVALKVPQFDPRYAEQMQARFLREAQSAAKLSHPNICQVYDVGEIDGRLCMAMEYIEGQTLAAVIKRGKPLPERQAALLVRKVALAVAAAHQKGLIHRDLKPANIMLGKTDATKKTVEPKVMDFGLAKSLDTSAAQLTQSGMILGTPCYMSKEQWSAKDGNVGPASDVYSLGIILYELLTGKLPYDTEDGEPPTAWLARLLTLPPASPRDHRPEISPEMESICLKAIAKETGDRYATMSELATALQGRLTAETTTATVVPVSGDQTAANPPAEFSFIVPDSAATQTLMLPRAESGFRWRWPRSRKAQVGAAGLAVTLLLGVIVIIINHADGSKTRIETNASKAVVTLDKNRVTIDAVSAEEESANEAVSPKATVTTTVPKPAAGSSTQQPASLRNILKSDALVKRLVGHTEQVVDVAFSPDSTLAASASGDNTVRLWNTTTGSEVHCFSKVFDSLYPKRVTFSSDGKRLIASGRGTVVWDVESHAELSRYTAGGEVLAAIPGTTSIIVGGDGRNQTLDIATGASRRWPETAKLERVIVLADGQTAVSCGRSVQDPSIMPFDDAIGIWRIPDGTLERRLAGNGHTVAAVACSHDGKWIAACGGKKGRQPSDKKTFIRLWNLQTGQELSSVEQNREWGANCLAFLPDGQRLLVGLENGSLAIWDSSVAQGQGFVELPQSLGNVFCLAISGDHKHALTGYASGGLRLIDLEELLKRLGPAGQEPNLPDPTRDVAERLLRKGIRIKLVPSGPEITELSRLPRGEFFITNIGLLSNAFGGKLTDEDLAAISRLPAVAKVREISMTTRSDVSNESLRLASQFTGLTTLHLRSRLIDSAGVAYLRGNTRLTSLGLGDASLTDESISVLLSMPQLERLWLPNTGLSDAGVQKLSGLTSLKELDLSQTNLSEDTFAALTQLERLESLTLTQVQLPKGAARSLASMTTLTTIKLDSAKLTAADVSELVSLPKLQEINLSNTTVGDEIGELLGRCVRLSMATLDGTAITDHCLKDLQQLKTLTVLQVRRTNVTAAGIAAFKKARPRCTVLHSLAAAAQKVSVAPTAITSDPDRAAAEWALTLPRDMANGPPKVVVETDGTNPRNQSRSVSNLSELPAERFRLKTLTLPSRPPIDPRHAEEMIAPLADLTILSIYDSAFTPNLIQAVSTKQKLTSLTLSNLQHARRTDIGPDEVAALSALTNLDTLDISGWNLSDDGLRTLRPLKHLEALWIGRSQITNAGLAEVKEFPSLTVLGIQGCGVGDEGMQQLTTTKLAYLAAGNTKIGNAGLSHLAKIPSLKILSLEGTRITDEGLAHLASLQNLRTIHLLRTAITSDGVAALRKSLPQLQTVTIEPEKSGE